MPSLESYRKELDYSYAPGLFPCMEAVRKRPDAVRRVIVSNRLAESPAKDSLLRLCEKQGIRVETADRALARLSGKENVFAAAVFEKRQGSLSSDEKHLVLHRPSDKGNLGTMLRTALGFGFRNIAVIRPAADWDDPHVIRASMGAMFSLEIAGYDDFSQYRQVYPGHALFPFMLSGSLPPEEAARGLIGPYALILGNEGSGLPQEFASLGQAVRIPHSGDIDSLNLAIAAGIGMYVFSSAAS